MRFFLASSLAVDVLLAVAFSLPQSTPKQGETIRASAVTPVPPVPFGIKFPDVTPAPGPTPAPRPVDPTATVKLTAETVYVVSSDTPFLLFDSPPGRVTITKEAGPLRMRGRFIDGSGKVETRTLSGKYLAIVEAASTGTVELIAVPVGADAEQAATRKTIDVEAGQGPQPPPKPEPAPAPKPKPPDVDPEPKPQPTPTPKGPYFFVTVTETVARTPAEAKVLNDTAYWNTLVAAGHDWRHYDQHDKNAITGRYVERATKDEQLPDGTISKPPGLPALIVVTKTGKLVRKVPLPKSTADVTSILRELEGGAK